MLNPNPLKRPSAKSLLTEFNFFNNNSTRSSKRRSLSLVRRDNNISKKDYEDLKLQFAKTKSINQTLEKENEFLKAKLQNSENSTLILELEMNKKKKESLEIETKLLNEKYKNIEKEFHNLQIDFEKSERNLQISRETITNLETEIKQVKDINLYLFQQTKVIY